MKGFLAVMLIVGSGTVVDADASSNREITVSLKVPDGGWSVSIEEIYQVDSELWVISGLSRREGMAIQMICTASDTGVVMAPDLPIKHFILGKTWNWKNEEAYTFLKERKAIAGKLKKASRLYKKRKKDEKG